MESTYERLSKININQYIEKKNGLSYLSWSWAVDQLLRNDPEASWKYEEPRVYADTLMVFCTVTAFGRARTAQLPVMDYKNRAIPNPDAFQVNFTMQRALAKGIALHGLGLYIYSGEDLPEADKADKIPVADSPQSVPAVETINLQQIAQIKSLLTETGHSLQRLLAFLRVDTLNQIPTREFQRVVQLLERAKRRAS